MAGIFPDDPNNTDVPDGENGSHNCRGDSPASRLTRDRFFLLFHPTPADKTSSSIRA
jgi:hypothetical protein